MSSPISPEKTENLISNDDTQDRLECIICCSILRDPVLTICGHRFCRVCLTKWMKNNQSVCPIDKKKLNDGDTFPDNFTKREIARTLIMCSNTGCSALIPALDFDNHVETCPHQKIGNQGCPFVAVGCDSEETLSAIKLRSHMRDNLSNHLQLLLKGHHNLTTSIKACRKQCPHDSKCLLEELDETNGKLPLYLNDIYEKLTELDQRMKECSIKIHNVESQSPTDKILGKCSRQCGVLVWEIKNFSQLKVELNKNLAYPVYSPTFASSEFGYCFKMRMSLSPKNLDALAFFLHLTKGEYDHTLRWPFVGQISVSIIHPEDPNLRLNSVIKSKNCDAFNKPFQEINTYGYGFLETARMSLLMSRGYLKDDKLTVKATVKTFENDELFL